MSSQPLSRKLRRPFIHPPCANTCITCKTAEFHGMCYSKNAVYSITCSICQRVYIGQTKRTVKSRIKEDLTNPREHVYLHSKEHRCNSESIFKWKILKIVPSLSARLSTEALFIKQHGNNLINGCNGKEILTFLQ